MLDFQIELVEQPYGSTEDNEFMLVRESAALRAYSALISTPTP